MKASSRKLLRRTHRPLLWCAIVLTVIGVGFPLYWMVVSSFMPYTQLFSRFPSLLPAKPTLEHYHGLLTLTDFPVYFRNSLIVALLATTGTVIAGALAGYGLTRFRFRGRDPIASAVLFTYMFPPILLSIPLFVLLKQAGLANNLVGLAFAHISFALPLAIWLAMIFFEAIPTELDEAAMVDGATRLGALIRVVLPVALPGIVATAVFVFVLSWNDFLFSLVLIVDETKKTLPVGVAGFVDATSVEWGLLMAGGVLITLPIMIGFAVVQRWLIQGLSAGAIKG